MNSYLAVVINNPIDLLFKPEDIGIGKLTVNVKGNLVVGEMKAYVIIAVLLINDTGENMLACMVLHTVIADIPIKAALSFAYSYRSFCNVINDTVLDLRVCDLNTVYISGITVLSTALSKESSTVKNGSGFIA